MNDETLAIHIEGLLFAIGKPLSRADLATLTQASDEQVAAALAHLGSRKSGVVVVDDGHLLELRVAPEVAHLVEQVRRDENSRDIGRAGLEVVAAILYRGPLSRSEIDFIRGVNSSQILRTLTMRGLIRRVANPKDERSYLYEATTELLAAMGATHPRDMPDFDAVRDRLVQLEVAYRNAQQENSHEV